MRIVRPDGSIMKVSDRQDLDLLHATQVNIGMFGVVSEITLQVTDAFWLHDRVWREDFDALMEQYDALAATHRHFGFFWCPTSASRDLYCLPDTTKVSNSKDYDVCEIKVMDITDARTFHEGEHEKIAYSSEVYAIHYVPNFHELEYAVPAQHGKEALRRVRELILSKHRDCIFPVEYRFTKGDPAWISPFNPGQRHDFMLGRPERRRLLAVPEGRRHDPARLRLASSLGQAAFHEPRGRRSLVPQGRGVPRTATQRGPRRLFPQRSPADAVQLSRPNEPEWSTKHECQD